MRASLYEPVEWARLEVDRETVPPGESATVGLTLAPPAYVVPGDLACALVAWTPRGPAAVTELAIQLANEGDSYAVQIERRWAIRVDAEGKKTGAWKPIAQLVTRPGERVRQEVRLFNRGSADETFRLALSGAAAQWTTGFPREALLKAGGEHWLGIDVSVPEGAQQGAYALALTVTSVTHPAVSRSMSYTIPVATGP